MQREATTHVPVMEREVVSVLVDAPAAKTGTPHFLDCTFGGGGHSKALLAALPAARVDAFDRDGRAVALGQRIAAELGGRLSVSHSTFSGLASVASAQRFAGMLADLGVSTDQLKENRGFSFRDDAPLDMRMDEAAEQSAAEIVNGATERELLILLKKGGMGEEARAVSRAIVRARPIATTKELAAVVDGALHGKLRAKKGSAATVAFQAIRIAVNREFEEIEALLELAPRVVASGGRLAVITFHSLEDRLVASEMRRWESGPEFSALWPGAQQSSERPLGTMVTKKPILPSDDEVARNPSARSARLRVFEFH